MTLIEELRAKEIRDNRDLLDRAADTIEDLQTQLDIAYEQHERNMRESMRNYNMAVDKLHLAYRQLIKDARAEVLEDIKAHAQHADGRVVYVITEEQLVHMYERHGGK
jgi:t-SNARE complex subunit (syntaxin)